MASQLIAGVDLGGTHFQVGIVDPDNRIVARRAGKTNASKGADAVLDAMADAINDAANEAGGPPAAVGIAAPGACDVKQGIVLQTGNLGWVDFPLAQHMQQRLGASVAIAIDNDVNAAVFGECQLGAAKGTGSALGVWVGTGIGAGIVVNDDVFYGPLWTAGEFGQQILTPHALTGEQRVEYACSRNAVTKRLIKLLEMQLPSAVPEILREMESTDDLRRINAAVLAQAYTRGDELTRTVIHESADLLGIAIANACTLLAIPTILLGGGLSEALANPYRDRIAATANKHVFPASHADQLDFRLTNLRENAGLLGAAMLARRRIDG